MSKELLDRIEVLENKVKNLELRTAYNIIDSDPNLSLAKSRMLLEKMVKQLYKNLSKKNPRSSKLSDILNEDVIRKKVPSRIMTRMHSIRSMSNLGVHGHNVNKDDASDVLDSLCVVIEWYLDIQKGPVKNSKKLPYQKIFFSALIITILAILTIFIFQIYKSNLNSDSYNSVLANSNFVHQDHNYDLTGSWNLISQTTKSDHTPYEGMVLEFIVHLLQDGNRIEGHGEKRKKNGIELNGTDKTSISITGLVKQNTIKINYKEPGLNRLHGGVIDLLINENSLDTLKGSLKSDSGNGIGIVFLVKK